MPKTKPAPGVCDGCGKPFEQRDGYSGWRDVSADVEVAPEVQVTVCGSTRYNKFYYAGEFEYAPKLPCLRKAFEAKNVCPGCGEEDTGRGPYDVVCPDCRDALARSKEIVGDRPSNYCLDVSLITEHYPESSPHRWPKDKPTPRECADELLDIIVRIAAAQGPRHTGETTTYGFGAVLGTGRTSAHSGMPRIELDDEQRAAVEELGAALRGFADTMYYQGRRDGRNLLGGLASGEYSIRDFEEKAKRWTDEEEEGSDE
jgi:hypothetical protein